MESTVRALALQVQRHQMSIEIAKGRILHVTLLIFVLTYEGMDTIHVEKRDQKKEKETKERTNKLMKKKPQETT